MSIAMLAAGAGPAVAYAVLAIEAHYRQQDQQRIQSLHQQADSEDWHGQVFARMEVEE